MQTLTDRFKIFTWGSMASLNLEELEKLLRQFPIEFQLVEENVPPQEASAKYKDGVMEVYHGANVIEIYPPNGSRLYNAHLTNMDFPIRPDNIMDDQIGLRCCFHPRLSSFGIGPRTFHGDEIEIDIYKYSKEHKYGNNR